MSVWVNEILKKLDMKTTIFKANAFGKKQKNGTWTGMIGNLHSKKADFGPLDFSPSYSRSQVIQFSEWIGTDPVVIVSKSASRMTLPFLLLKIFTPTVWTCVVLSIAVFSVIMHVSDVSPLKDKGSSLGRTFHLVGRIFVQTSAPVT